MKWFKQSRHLSSARSSLNRRSRVAHDHVIEAGRLRRRGPLTIGCPVFAELLESRVLLSFVAHMSAQATGALNANYAIDLTTTGDQASKWVVNWGDLSSNTYTAPPGGFSVPFSPTHQYTMATSYGITSTATSNSNSNVTSTTGFALNMNFGTTPFQQSGKVVDKPPGTTGNANGEAMAIDTSNGDIYVVGPFTPSGGGATVFGITRYFPASSTGIGGVKDSTGFGSNGTLQALALGGTTTEVDIPYTIVMDSRLHIAYVAGKTTVNGVTTWGFAIFNAVGSGTYINGITGTLQPSGKSLPNGQANALVLDGANPDAIMVGTAWGGKIGVAAINLNTLDFDGSFNSGSPLSIATGASGTATANSAIDLEQNNGNDELVVGGTTTYTQGSTSAGDFTLVEIDDNGTPDSGFGNQGTGYPGVYRLNIGNKLGVGHACNIPSLDSCYSLLEYSTVTTNDGFIAVGGSNALGGSNDSFALARFSMASAQPALDTSFGNHSDGLAIGMGVSGDAYTAILDPNTNYILAAGSYLGDFEVARFTNATSSGGAVDNSFGFRGFETDFGSTSGVTTDVARSIAIDTWSSAPLADIVVGGYTFTNSSNAQIALADYLPNNCVAIS